MLRLRLIERDDAFAFFACPERRCLASSAGRHAATAPATLGRSPAGGRSIAIRNTAHQCHCCAVVGMLKKSQRE